MEYSFSCLRRQRGGHPVWLPHGEGQYHTPGPQRKLPKGRDLEMKRQREKTSPQFPSKNSLDRLKEVGTGALGQILSLPCSQAPMQKQQQSLAASNSACLTRSEWWRHWVPYWKSSGSSGPRSQPVAWNRKTQRADRLKGFYRAKNQGPLSLTELTKETTTMFSTPATHGSLPAKFLGFVSSWDLGHATFGHLRGSCLWIIWGDKFMCFIQVKEDALKAYFVLTSHIPTVPPTGHSWGLIFKEGISKDAHQSYLN